MPTTPAVGGRLHAGAGGRAKAVECGPFVAQRASEPPMSLIRFNHRARRIAVALSLASTAFLAAAGEAELPKLVVGDRYVYHQTRSDLPPARSESRAEFKVGWVSRANK